MQTIPEQWQRRNKTESGDWADDATPFDFIVVGAGAGGAPLAARLVERGFSVLVIDMGPKPDPAPDALVENTEVPILHTEVTEDPRHSLRYFVKHFHSDPDESLDPKLYRPPEDAAVLGEREDETGVFYPRAQGIGGCTTHHAMITVCGPWQDWNEIAEATNDPSWRGDRMRTYFQRLENCLYDRPWTFLGWLKSKLLHRTGWENGRHGHGGWLQTSLADLRLVKQERRFVRVILESAIAVVESGSEQIREVFRQVVKSGPGPALDPNHWQTMMQSQAGVSLIPTSITADGRRSGPRERLLHAEKRHPDRLKILCEACVTGIAFEDAGGRQVGGIEAKKRAIGVKVFPRAHAYQADPQAEPVDHNWREHGLEKTIYCRREVLLCGGAFSTPQILMLSGIAPADELPDGITSLLDLPGVGKNLQDRYEVPIVAKVTDRFRSLDSLRLTSLKPEAAADEQLQRWRSLAGKADASANLCSTNGGLLSILTRSAQEDSIPDLFLFALAGRFPGYSVGYSRPSALQPGPTRSQADHAAADQKRYMTWLVLKGRTRNRSGVVRLKDSNPFRRPEINFSSFPDAPDDANLEGKSPDLEAMHEGVQLVKKMLDLGQKKGTIESYELPNLHDFQENERKWIKHIAWGHHACGTCRIGADNDADAVLDSRFRVRGVEGLRVVDASVFPRIVGYFIVTNIYMVAEKAADVVSEDNGAKLGSGTAREPVLPNSREYELRRVYPKVFEEREAELIRQRRQQAGL